MKTARKIVYDVGMNNGDDSAYYLNGGYQVVGIDANPSVCESALRRFGQEVSEGRMTVINEAVSSEAKEVKFFINRDHDRISTLHPERFENEVWASKAWIETTVKSCKLSDLISQLGYPFYVKIDVEFHDAFVLMDLLEGGIRPTFLSAEVHDIEVYDLMVRLGYNRFQVVRGNEVERRFKGHSVSQPDGEKGTWSFPWDATGPFGADLPDEWVDEQHCRAMLAKVGLSWTDVHATRIE